MLAPGMHTCTHRQNIHTHKITQNVWMLLPYCLGWVRGLGVVCLYRGGLGLSFPKAVRYGLIYSGSFTYCFTQCSRDQVSSPNTHINWILRIRADKTSSFPAPHFLAWRPAMEISNLDFPLAAVAEDSRASTKATWAFLEKKKTGLLRSKLAGWLTGQPKLAVNSRSSCLHLPSAGITGGCQHTWSLLSFLWLLLQLLNPPASSMGLQLL